MAPGQRKKYSETAAAHACSQFPDHTISILHAFLPNDEDKDNFTNVYFVMEHMDVALQAKACAHLQCTDAIR